MMTTICDRLAIRLVETPARLDASELAHVIECDDCRESWVAAALLEEVGAGGGVAGRCAEQESIGTLLDGTPLAAEREARLAHVAACGACIAELRAMLADLERLDGITRLDAPPELLERRAIGLAAPVDRRRRRLRSAALVAAAGIGFVAIGLGLMLESPDGPVGRPSPAPGTGQVRGGDTVAIRALEPVGEVTAGAALRFVWSDSREAGGPVRLVIVDVERARTVFEVRTREHSIVLDTEELGRLRPGVQYDWFVEPIGPEGRSAPSVPGRFELREP